MRKNVIFIPFLYFFQQKDCVIHNQRPFLSINEIPKKWKIPLRNDNRPANPATHTRGRQSASGQPKMVQLSG